MHHAKYTDKADVILFETKELLTVSLSKKCKISAINLSSFLQRALTEGFVISEFACQMSGLCLPRHAIQDGRYDCNRSNVIDLSDELFKYEKCSYNEFRCHNSSRCIPTEWVFDNKQDCKDGSDEKNPLYNCSQVEYQCPNGRCILRNRVKDGHKDCISGADESNASLLCMSNEHRCADSAIYTISSSM